MKTIPMATSNTLEPSMGLLSRPQECPQILAYLADASFLSPAGARPRIRERERERESGHARRNRTSFARRLLRCVVLARAQPKEEFPRWESMCVASFPP